jgi:hypothetical protein
MNPTDRARLTAALREHVARLAADLRAALRAPGDARQRAQRLHADEQVGDDFEVWTDLLARRAAVLWVLKSVYVRVLEDRGLLVPGRLLDGEAQQLFEKLAPNLGETAFLRWIYRDLASPDGGLPELFAPQPAELLAPPDERSRDLLAFWRHRDPDTGAHWTFTQEKFEGELMGDLYQELDPVVKDRFALCQTPDFVRQFILDRTLTPAIETFGADTVRLLDPACGSGHFLIDGLKRLVAATAETQPAWDRRRVVADALSRVVGIDLNDYACALARARLVMTAAELAGVTTLQAAAQFHPHVYWADGLEQVERGQDTRGQQLDLLDPTRDEAPRASLTRPEVRRALRDVLEPRFHAVVANPPYITEKDEARKAYHREKVGKTPRYVSAYRQYSLGAPFIERCFQLAVRDGFVGLITSNNFLKREFGKPLIETVLAALDLTLVVDTSQAYIPFHGTPTVLLFGRQRRPAGGTVRAVMGKRGESGVPDPPAHGKVWSSIAEGWDRVGFETEYVSVAEVPRATLAKHPWSVGGGGAAELKQRLEAARGRRLGDVVELIGFGAVTRADEVFVLPAATASRLGIDRECVATYGYGEAVRDWSFLGTDAIVLPYSNSGTVPESDLGAWIEWAWRNRQELWLRQGKGFKTKKESGGAYYEYSMFYPERHFCALKITFAFVATHNHFVLDRGGKVFNRSAPVIKLPPDGTEDDHLALLGLLNSSAACFWMKQVFHPKGMTAENRNHPDPARMAHEFAATGLQSFPVPEMADQRAPSVQLARRVDTLGRERTGLLSASWVADALERSATAADLRTRLAGRWLDADVLRERMVALQEELDWTAYVAYGLADASLLCPEDRFDDLTCPRGARPFERLHGRVSTVRAGGEALALADAEVPPVGTLPAWMEPLWQAREAAIQASADLQLIETPVYKRAWRDTEQNVAEPEYRRATDAAALRGWLSDRLEAWTAQRSAGFTVAQAMAALQDDRALLVAAEALTGRQDFSLDALVAELVAVDAVPQHPSHVYTADGLAKRAVWEDVWALQRREDAGEAVGTIPVPPEYSQGSRGKSTDFLKNDYWRLRGKLDVPKERFVAFTEVPGRAGAETLYGWAGWTPLQRLKALLAIDEGLEDGGVPLADRIGLLDSAWRLLPDVAREDPSASARLEAELQALVGLAGPSREQVADWRARFPPPGSRGTIRRGRRAQPGPAQEVVP